MWDRACTLGALGPPTAAVKQPQAQAGLKSALKIQKKCAQHDGVIGCVR